MKKPALNVLPDTCGNFLRFVDTDALCKAALGTVLFHDIMQGILGKAGGLLNILKPLVAVFALGHRGRELSCFSAFHGAHAFLCRSKNSIEELACIGEVGLQRTFLILSGFQAQLDDKGPCARFHSG